MKGQKLKRTHQPTSLSLVQQKIESFTIVVDECERIPSNEMQIHVMIIMLKIFFSHFSSSENTLKIKKKKCFARKKNANISADR